MQNWYADDSSCVEELSSVRRWFDRLLIDGPAYGYFPEPSKTVLVVGSSDVERASDLFRDLGVNVVTGSWFPGGFVGERSLAADFVSNKVRVWCECIQSLSDVAIGEPQALFTALARSLHFEWNHIQWVIPECGTLFASMPSISSFIHPYLVVQCLGMRLPLFPPYSFWWSANNQLCGVCFFSIPVLSGGFCVIG